MSFLFVEVNGLFHPGFENGGNFFHGVDHGSDLDVQSFSEKYLYCLSVTCLGLSHQVLEFGEVCLEAIILLSSNLFQGLEFISGCLICMIWVEHVSECFLYVVEVFVCCFDIGMSENVQPGVCKVFPLSFAHPIEQGY